MKKPMIFALSLLMAACATLPYEPYAREVKKKPREGGVIALKPAHRSEDRARADFLMGANCGHENVVKVKEEGEIVVGEKTNTSSSKSQDAHGTGGFRLGGIAFASTAPAENTNTQSQTTQLKEWHIAYECHAAAGETLPGRGKKTVSRK